MPSNYQLITQENIRKRGTDFDDIGRFLAEQLYSDRTHFVYELLQNAEDAIGRRARRPQSRFRRSVEFRLHRDRLELSHFGEPFDGADVRGICDVLRGTKSDDATQIGRFGIGFKSVYAYTASPEIHSGEEHFRIERYIRPRAVPTQPLRDGETLFVLPFDRSAVPAGEAFEQIRERLRSLGSRTLLFLGNIDEIAWTSEGVGGGVYRRRDRPQGEARRSTVVGQHPDGSELIEHWLVFERPVVEPDSGNVAKVEAAFRVVKDEATGRDAIVKADDSELVVFFPTEKTTNLGFLIQGPYRTTPARDNIVLPDPWNGRLIEETATLVSLILPKIRDMGLLTATFLEVLPIHSGYFAPYSSAFYPIFERVRKTLTERKLLPTESGHFVSAGEAKLARSAALRELLSDQQLRALYRAGDPVRWLSAEITYDRTPNLRRYLLELGVEEVTADGFARRFDEDFVEGQTDGWMIRLYRFLDEQRALWRAASTGLRFGGGGVAPLRHKPFLRLRDGSHVAPFRPQSGEPQAFLPPGVPTDLPTVKGAIAADEQALEFLRNLGLSEPDIVDEVIEKTLPKYRGQESHKIDEHEHDQDVRKIMLALGTDSESKERRLTKSLSGTPFLFAQNASTGRTALQVPSSIYVRSAELEAYFEGNPSIWFLDERYTGHEQRLRALGVSAAVRVSCGAPMKHGIHAGHVVVEDYHGWHVRGRNGFDPGCEIDGLDHALRHPTLERSRYVWNSLLGANFRHVRGVVETSTRKSFEGSTSEDRFSKMGVLATDLAWLPDGRGEFKKPEDLALGDLPEGFENNEALATVLRMRASEEVALASKLGVDPEDLDFLRQNKEEFEQWKEEVKKKRSQAAARAEETDEGDEQAEGVDFGAELESKFEQESSSDPGEPPLPPGPVGSPGTRRERTQEQIEETKREEPEPEQRFSRVPRRIWEGKNRQVRTFLHQQYGGKCQVCSDVFPKRDGEPYFEGLYLVSATRARWVDRPGNVLCLCATCSAKFQHGAVEASNILEQVDGFRARNESGGKDPVLRLRLCGESSEIRFTEQHMIDLQELARSRPEVSSVSEGPVSGESVSEGSVSDRVGDGELADEQEAPVTRNGADRDQVEVSERFSNNADPGQPRPGGKNAEPDVPEVSHAPNGVPQAATPVYPGNDSPGSSVAEVPTPRDAALALGSCLPDGEKVLREKLLADAAAELGYSGLPRKVRRALNRALNAEHNADRLHTDWERVWRPKKR